jgi:hypothetical protein
MKTGRGGEGREWKLGGEGKIRNENWERRGR